MKKHNRMLKMISAFCALLMLIGTIPALSFTSVAATVEKNVSAGKSGRSSASSNVPGLTDGNVAKIAVDIHWNADVTNSACWAEVDLEQAYDLAAVTLVQYYGDSRHYKWVAYASNDNTKPISEWTKIAEKNDTSVSTSAGYKAAVTEAVNARYVRIYGTYGSANVGFHFNEIVVYANVPFETKTYTLGQLTASINEQGIMTVSGKGTMPDYSTLTARPYHEFNSIVKGVVVEEGVTGIGKNAFAGFENLSSVSIADSVKTIGENAFANCGAVATLDLSSALTAISENAFNGTTISSVHCSKSALDLHASLTTAGNGNIGLWLADFDSDAESPYSGIIDGKILWSYENNTLTVKGTGAIPELTESTRPWQFIKNEIESIRIGMGITSIGKTAFARMNNIEEVYISDSVTTIYNDAFAYNGSIDYVRFPANLTNLLQGVFYSTSITTIGCSLTYDEWKAGATVALYNDNVKNANWIKEEEHVTLTNLTKGKEVEASAGTKASVIVDGNKGGSFWDGGVAPAEVTIDIGTGAFVNQINVVTYYGDGRYYNYEVYASIDGRNFVFVAEKNNDAPATAAGETYYFEEPLNARYIRVVMTKNSSNPSVHLYEVTALGSYDPDYVEPEKPDHDLDDPDNIAYGKPTRSSLSTQKSNRVTDGSADTYWTGEYYPTYVDIDLLEEYALDEIIVYMPVRQGRYYYYTVYGSNDLSTFDRLYQKRTNDVATNDGDCIKVKDLSYRFIRVYIEYVSGAGAAYLSEVRVHGTPTGENTGELRTGSIDEILGITDFDKTEYAAPITNEETIENVYSIIDRTVGSTYRSWFTFVLAENTQNDNDYYTIENAPDGKILITAGDGVCLAAGLNYYYKYYCNVEISEQARQTKMPSAIIPVKNTIRRETPYKIRYAFNYCTLDYSFAFYGEEDFIKENDWLALCGVNVVLDLAGQEAVWIKFLMNFGYTFDEARDWIAGPAYYAWQFMDNLENFGGPVSDGWIIDRLNMARRTQRFKRSLGIQTVLQGYAGMVPTNFADYQDETILKQGGWCGLSRPDMIRTDGELYDRYAALFYEAQRWALGETTNYYAADPFHEGGIRPSDLNDATIAAEVLDSLLAYDSEAVWMVQAWWSNPTNDLLKGMGDYRHDHVIILDLTADKWNTTKYGGTTLDATEFNGTDWVWCLLKNYGGNPSMDGGLSNLATAIPEAYKNSNYMKGVGLISEATLDNPVVYQLLFDMAWETTKLDLNSWLDDYVVRRYGAESADAREAWDILLSTVYNRQGNSAQITASVPDYVGKAYPSQNELQLEKALKLLLTDFNTLSESEAYMYDLSELMRQMVNNYALYAHNDVVDAFNDKDLEAFKAAKAKYLAAFDVLNMVLGTEKDFLVGTWIGRAEDWAAKYDDFSKDSLPFSAKALITTWAGAASASALPDYAYRHYEGMMIDVYKARWENYLNKQEAFLESGTEIVKNTQNDYFHFYWNWIMNTPEYTREVNNTPSYMYALAQKVLTECTVRKIDEANVGNVAFEQKATATTEVNSVGSSGGFATNTVDGSVDTYWDGGNYSKKPELIVDLGTVYDLSKLNVVTYFDGSRYYHYELYTSVDGETYTLAATKNSNTPATKAGDSFDVSVSARYIKLVGLYNSANEGIHVCELRAYSDTQFEKGDVNRDGSVNISDVTTLLDVLSGKIPEQAYMDLDGDKVINIRDVTTLLNIISSN